MIETFLSETHPLLCSPAGTVLRADYDLFSHECEFEADTWSLETRSILDAIYAYAENPERKPIDGFLAFDYPTGIIVAPSEYAESVWKSRRTAHFARLQAQFEGWSICFREGSVPEDYDGIERLLNFPFGKPAEAEGRVRAVYECIVKAYPYGKSDTWEAVEAKTGYSRRHLNRALSKYDPGGTWAKGGHPPAF